VRQYSDGQLANAIQSSRSWRGVLHKLGLAGTSAAAMRSVRGHADRLHLDYTHFTGRRRWSDQDLAAAIKSAATWSEATGTLGLVGGSNVATIRGHAVRLSLDTAAWFELCGYHISWPLEPCRYDILVWMGTYGPDEIDHFVIIDGASICT
jgi:hypothetical protein